MKGNIEYWGDSEEKYVGWADKDEAIKNLLSKSVCEGYLEICGFVKKRQTNLGNDAETIVEDLIKIWDKKYGAGAPSKITKKMRGLGYDFVRKMSELYNTQQYEIACRERIDIQNWIKKNCRDCTIPEDEESK